ncbi:uncharacterized protein LOC126424540 isoform X1 [Schistocerca serialis cubense]|uniref:uncharacterized protein LOC126424540 isoform X1 n=1 Tax=Schistocerca serialis cubense TaxID=2023355 RepID=UPI00214E8DB3|nr:uncharacterized protein LOC126424540 isoform X1 [Schistocerca serialis cubense]
MSEVTQSSSSEMPSIDVPGKTDTEFMMSIVIISTADLAKSMKEALLEYHKAHEERYKLYVHVSERVKRLLSNLAVHVDYYIILADPRRADAADKIKEDLLHLSPVFLATGRCVIAVSWPEGIPPHLVATCSAEVHNVCRDKMLHKLVQREEGPAGKKHLAERLLRLARTARGLTGSGIPNVTGCFNPGHYWHSSAGATVMLPPWGVGGDGYDSEQ